MPLQRLEIKKRRTAETLGRQRIYPVSYGEINSYSELVRHKRNVRPFTCTRFNTANPQPPSPLPIRLGGVVGAHVHRAADQSSPPVRPIKPAIRFPISRRSGGIKMIVKCFGILILQRAPSDIPVASRINPLLALIKTKKIGSNDCTS